ncbi:MAG: trimethylamine methyltransferase family protein [Armatimonadota bacterium]
MKLTTRCMSVFSDDEMERIWNAALRVWAEVPLRAQGTDEFMQLVRDYGCEIDGERITFPQRVRDDVLGRIDEARRQNGPARPAEVANDHLDYSVSGQAFYCFDLEAETLRQATTQDQVQWSWICDMFPGLGRSHPTFIPQDVPASYCDLHTFGTIILNSKRPHRVSVYNADLLEHFMQLQAVCDGSLEAVKANPTFAAKCWVNTPFMITRENIEVGMKARELLGQPLQLSTMPVAGVATPVTLAGSTVQTIAEVLALNCLSMAVDGRLCGNVAGPLAFDMRTGIHTQVGPDVELVGLAGRQMGAYVFGGEFTGIGGPTTTAQTPGAQSVMEKALSTMFAICSGLRSFGSLGILATADVGSVVQLMLDLELMKHFERLLQGVEVDEERLAEEVIKEVAPRGAYYLNHDHTAKFFRSELYMYELVDRRVPMAWLTDPANLLDNARAKAKRIAAEAHNQCPLTDDQKRQVQSILADGAALAQAKR